MRTRRAKLRTAVIGLLAALCIAPQARAGTDAACDVTDAVAHALPAVVNISVVQLARDRGEGAGTFHGARFMVGSGFIIDPSGIIATNQHVIEGAALIRVTFQDKSQVTARLIGAASLVDLALLKVNVPHPLPTLSFADSDRLKIGQPVIAIGNPIGVGTSVSTGSISGVNRNLMRTPFDDFLQTDAAINPGNSGGPLLDCSGHVVGVNTALLSNNKLLGSIGLGFAMPSNDVKMVAAKLQDPHNMPNWIGVHLQDMTASLAMLFGRSIVSGAIVTGVDPGSPAARASLVPGDIITGVLGRDLPDSRAVMRAIVPLPSTEPITLSVWHRDSMRQVELHGQPWPDWNRKRSEVLASQADIDRALASGLGLNLRKITAADRRDYHLGDVQGVLVDWVLPGSQADNLGIAAGNVIEQVGEQPARNPQQVMAALNYGKPEAGDLVAVLVHGKSGAQWMSYWVGGPKSPDLVTGESPAEESPSTHNASMQR